MKVLRINRLRTAILSNCISDIEKFKTIERRVNLNTDQKRMWFEKIKNVIDKVMIDSIPVSLSYFEKREV